MYVTHPVPETEALEGTSSQIEGLGSWLTVEIEDALASRFFLERVWRECLRRYEGVPRSPNRVEAIPYMVPLEVTIGAIATDSIYAQSLDLVFTISPTITVRATGPLRGRTDDAKAMQEFANRIATDELCLRDASEEVFLDNVQLGTGVYYVPWVERVKKTRSLHVLSSGPKSYYVPVEDFLVPNIMGANPQNTQWIGLRFWLTQGELNARAAVNTTWDIDGVSPAADVSWVRNRRETLGHQQGPSERLGHLFEIWDIYALYDIDEDGIEEDLYIVWDRTSRKVITVRYNPFVTRPVSKMVYQRRAGLAYGLGVMEMLGPYQEEITETHIHRVANMMLANNRMWKVRSGLLPGNFRVIPGRIVQLDDPDSLKSEQLADVYPSSSQAEAITLGLAERRAGVNELSMPRPSQVLGSRTPGITTLSMLQQQSRRFTAAFDGMRLGAAEAVKQGLYRYHERVVSGDSAVRDYILAVLGDEQGQRVLRLLARQDFVRGIEVVMTASSASINREADRQSMVMLVQVLAQYYQRTLELVTIAANPQVPEKVREAASRIASVVGEVIDRTIRTFENVRDPATFIVEVEDLVDQQEVGTDVVSQLLAQLEQGGIVPPGAAGEGVSPAGGAGMASPANPSANGASGGVEPGDSGQSAFTPEF